MGEPVTVQELVAKLQAEFPGDYEVTIEVPSKDLFNVKVDGAAEGEDDDGKPNCVLTTDYP